LKTVPAALCQRGLAKLRTNDRAGAVKDFEELIRKHPKAKERELALQQKALIHGQQNDNDAMAATFKMLIAEFPNTPAAAEASYWVGWSAFEQKEYKEAIEPLRKALELNKEEYFERASLRLMLAYFNLEDKEGLAREVESYTSGGGKAQVPYDVVRWLGRAHFETAQAAAKDKAPLESYIEDLKKAATYLGLLTARSDARPVDFYELGLTYNSLRIYDKAAGPLEKYLTSTKDPAPRAEGLLALAQTRIGLGELDAAQKLVEEASTLQAAGPLNAESRIIAGDIQMARTNYEEAAKAYHSVSLIIDDENITPRALEKGVDAYRKAGKEADANRLLNQLQSRYPEYLQAKVP
jgi:tetratricopeptide (TPR) repeat protein